MGLGVLTASCSIGKLIVVQQARGPDTRTCYYFLVIFLLLRSLVLTISRASSPYCSFLHFRGGMGYHLRLDASDAPALHMYPSS